MVGQKGEGVVGIETVSRQISEVESDPLLHSLSQALFSLFHFWFFLWEEEQRKRY